MKAPRGGVNGSTTRLDRPGLQLPWAQLSVHPNASACKGRGRAATHRGLGGGCVCSKGASSRSRRCLPKPGIAAQSAGRQRGVGAVGGPAGRIVPASTVKRGGATSLGSTASGAAQGGQSRPRRRSNCRSSSRKSRRSSRARASAQRRYSKNLAAPGPAVTSASRAAAALRCRSAAEGCADRLYGECGNARRGGVGDWVSRAARPWRGCLLPGEVPRLSAAYCRRDGRILRVWLR